MNKILKDIFTDVSLGPLLGLKGGTAGYLFYNLPRFSVDLDFDLLEAKADKPAIAGKIQSILKRYGEIKDEYVKYNTVFAILSYGATDYNIKIEISTRALPYELKDRFEIKEHLGVAMKVARPEYLFAGKFAALLTRAKMAMRDIFDIHFYAGQSWDLDKEVAEFWVGKSVKECLADSIAVIEKVGDNKVLDGLGELLDEKQKVWVKKYLKAETIFLLKNYLSIL